MSEQKDPIVISAAVRTPLSRFQGELSPLPAPRLGAAVIRAAVERAQVDGARAFASAAAKRPPSRSSVPQRDIVGNCCFRLRTRTGD
jgi:acetyl-CoA acetyltransferase